MAKKIKGVSSSMDDGLDSVDSLPALDDLDATFVGKDATLDLDKYGIWVKAEPEDFKDKASFDDKDMGLTDLSPDNEGLVPSAELELEPAPDSGMIDNLDIPEEESLSGLEDAGGGKDVSLEEELPSLEETVSFDEPAPVVETVMREPDSTAFEESNALAGDSSADVGGGDFEEVSLDDLGIEISQEVPDEEVTAKKTQTRATTPAPVRETEEAMPHIIDDEFAALPLELEDSGDLDKENGAGDDLVMEDLALPGGESIDGEDETISLDLEEESAGGTEMASAAGGEEVLEEIPELELGSDEGIELDLGGEAAAEEIDVPLSDSVSLPEAEEELDSLSVDLESEPAAAGGSAALLQKIESELRSIKTELTQLKSELGVLRGTKAAAPSDAAGARQAGKGDADFFEEEEDETIALTGEELDNILTTADIKEEEKAAPVPEPEAEISLDLGEDILSFEEPAAEEPVVALSDDIGFDEVTAPEPAADMTGDIEIEIPELDSGAGEIPDLNVPDDLESLEELTPGEGRAEAGEEIDTTGSFDFPEEPAARPAAKPGTAAGKSDIQLPTGLKEEIKSVLGYMDHLLESLPEEKIEEFAKSEYFAIYKKLFEELGLVS
jgi:pilus assembly protein FimV